MKIKFNSKVEEFLSFCKENNIVLYLVGGCIRDFLMNKECFDLDFALTSSYSEAINILNKKYKISKMDNYQSIKFSLDEYQVEISHARKEREYLDYRHPYEIEFVDDIELDYLRRDFTINAIYYRDGVFYDFANGLEDIKNKKIRVIGDPLTRFKEDPLRILRMIRFSCDGFDIDLGVIQLIKDNAYLLKELSEASFNKEFDRILLLNNLYIINEYKELFESYFDVKFNDLIVLNRLPSLEEKKTYLGIKNKSVYQKYKDVVITKDKIELTKLIYKFNKDIIFELVKYHDRVNETNILVLYQEIIANDYYCKNDLCISVEEIISITHKQELTSYYIDKISYEIISGNLANDKDAIKKYLIGVI